jgi:hypothetical protein
MPWARGEKMKADLFGPAWDFWAAARTPIEAVRSRIGVTPRAIRLRRTSPCARRRRAGDVAPPPRIMTELAAGAWRRGNIPADREHVSIFRANYDGLAGMAVWQIHINHGHH